MQVDGGVHGAEILGHAGENFLSRVVVEGVFEAHQAYDLIAWLESKGVKVPSDLSITGFDGISPPSGAPLLSTVEIPFRQIGITGAKRLSDMVHKRFDAPQHILLDCNLRAGETIAAPSKKKPAAHR